MHLLQSLLSLLPIATSVIAASSWSFDDASISIQGKKTGAAGGLKEKISTSQPLSKPIQLGSADSLKILLTTKDGKQAKRPHQTFLLVKDSQSTLETSFAFQVKENGKAKVEITQKDIPSQLLSSPRPLEASIVIASFGPSIPFKHKALDLAIDRDPTLPSPDKPLRYGKLPEIHHIFQSDPTSPPKFITIVFTTAVVFALPALLATWLSLGANLNHVTKAFGSSPIPHTLFFLSILAMEGVFFMYYTSWNLFQTLPGALGIGLVTFLSGSRALREVQQRRLAGFR